MQSGKHQFHGGLKAALGRIRGERPLAAPKRVYENNAFQHIDQHVDLGVAPGLVLLGCLQKRLHGRAHRSEYVMKNIAMVSAKMVEFSEENSDDRQAFIHEPMLEFGVVQQSCSEIGGGLPYWGWLNPACKKTFDDSS